MTIDFKELLRLDFLCADTEPLCLQMSESSFPYTFLSEAF